MSNLTLWTKDTFPMYAPSGAKWDTLEEFAEEMPMANLPKLAVVIQNNVLMEISGLDVLRANYNVPKDMTDQEAVDFINEERNKPAPSPTPEQSPATQAEVMALGQQMTDLELLIMEGGTTNV